ncbi:hypothetical protein [uncultured Gimesia sp.]|uniref:hypothetical protein n=1 Tax=uncultured Gimesia sp. TaxID=1678688 RepID=UPI0030D73557|tara:strand:- start:483 stop:689 length:207 start_codon:yes stop_codon:yes gene_type:complete
MAKDTDNNKRQIKIFINAEEHRNVRLAAALMDTTMAEFCRDIVLKESHDLTKNLKLPAETDSSGRKPA